MFEQTSRLAEKLATSVSRRRFLGSLGGWAAAAALGVAALLTGAGTARADGRPCSGRCCFYAYPCGRYLLRVDGCHDCPPSLNGCALQSCDPNVFHQQGGCSC
jgi:hypothetical protein